MGGEERGVNMTITSPAQSVTQPVVADSSTPGVSNFQGKILCHFLSRNKSEAILYSQYPCQAGHKVQNKVWDTIIDLGALML